MKIKKEKYDYYYNYTDFPKTVLLRESVVTICYILTENGIVGRGVSVCSKQDMYNEIEGKKLAKNHALRAMKGRHLDNFKRPEVIKLLIQTKCPFTKKGERDPDLSWWERKFLFGAKNMDKYKYNLGYNILAATITISTGNFDTINGSASIFSTNGMSNIL